MSASDEGLRRRLRRSAAPLLALPLLLCATPALAFTFITTSPGFLGWNARELTFRVNSANCSVSAAALGDAVQRALDAWNSVPTSGFTLKLGDPSTVAASSIRSCTNCAEPTIACSTAMNADTGGAASTTVGIALSVLNSATGYLVSSGLVLNSQAGAAANVANISADLLAVTIAHEMGHALGLGHSGDRNALMYFSLDEKVTLGLGQDDIDGITYLYGRNEFGGDGPLGCASVRTRPPGKGGPPGGNLAELAIWLAAAWIGSRRWRERLPGSGAAPVGALGGV